ncbi:hypothetical protein SBOR_3633 [Sclerotinia borealis F-4128]|uniref:Uncharacterized protein n=1 Tax=Sclerotinia borealis (strain F-4128) TaxID=1432307 RepID=W9CJA6_SCLBF|nr:hypothetical protein SBOR_3633 [Sclerotinia borealis F-4128]
MPAALGKRKRTSATTSTSSKLLRVSKITPAIPKPVSEEASDNSPEDEEEDEEEEEDNTEALDPQEIFRRHFEAQFKPLPVSIQKSKPKPQIVEEENEDDEDWDGLSENYARDGDEGEEEENGVQVVEHLKKFDSRIAEMSKGELRAFMSSKVPKSLPSPSISKLPELAPGSADDPGATESLNLKHDLALQRLLDESHLLTSSASSSDTNSHATHSLQGKNRLKALDMRVQALGGKTSIHTQESMPMNMRKGIVKKAEEREETRRREAKENGIVLETKGGGRGGSAGFGGGRGGGAMGRVERRKERSGTGGTFDAGPKVGRMRGATLNLSERDVVGIEGAKGGGGKKGRNGKSGGRGRGRGKRG